MSETTPEDRLADWLMTNLPRVHRWMTVGWRETMRDEAVALSREMLDAALIRDDRPPVGSTGAVIDDEAGPPSLAESRYIAAIDDEAKTPQWRDDSGHWIGGNVGMPEAAIDDEAKG